MPVVLIAAPASDDSPALVSAVARAVGAALGLENGDVVGALQPTQHYHASGSGATSPWPVVTIHGRDRGAEATTASCAAADAAVREWADAAHVALGGVWVPWVFSAA